MAEIGVGTRAADFLLADERGGQVRLSDFRGKRHVLLIFYPGDNTPGCTKQLCAVRDDQAKFDKLNCTVFGVNHADAASHQKFIKKHGLTSHLLIDPGKRVAKQYGAIKQFFGKPAIKRTVVLVGKDGVIHYYKHGLPPNEEIFEVLRTLNG